MNLNYLFLIILLFSLSSLADTVSEGILTFDDKNLKIDIQENAVRVTGDSNLILLIGECKEVNYVNYCLKNVTYDLETDKYEADMNMTKIEAEIEVTRTTPSTIIIADEYAMDVSLKNKGNSKAKNLIYEEYFPNSIKITNCDSCKIEANKIIYSGEILPDNTNQFSYNYIPLSDEQHTFNAKITYLSESENEIFTSPTTISPKQPFSVEFQYENSKPVIGEETQLVILVKNLYTTQVNVDNLLISVPSNLEILGLASGKIVSLGEFILDGETTYYNVNITKTLSNGSVVNETQTKKDKSNTKEFRFKITRKNSEPSIISLDAYYTRNEEMASYLGVKNIIGSKDITASVNNNLAKEYDEGSAEQIYIQLLNPYEKMKLFNISIIVNSNLFDEKKYFTDSIKEGFSKKLFNEYLNFPKINKTLISDLTYNITFYDEFKNEYKINKKLTFNILPLSGVKITTTGCTKKLKFDEECEYIVSVKNQLQGDLEKVFIRDTFDTKVINDGILYTKKNIDSQKTEIAYRYKIMYPKNSKDYVDNVTITTVVTYDYLGESYESKFNRTIYFEEFTRDKEFSIGLVKSFDATTFYSGQIYPVTFTVENKDTEQMKNLIVTMDESNMLDLVDFKEKTLLNLNPKEKATFRFFIKSKINDTLDTLGKLYFEDGYGVIYEKDFSLKKIKFLENIAVGPVVHLSVETGKNYSLGELIPLKIKVKNAGTDEVKLYIQLFDEKKEIKLMPNSALTYNYDVLASRVGNITLGPLSANYTYGNRNNYVVSDVKTVEVTKHVLQEPVVIEEVQINKSDQNINISEEINLELEELNKSESWFKKLLIFFKLVKQNT